MNSLLVTAIIGIMGVHTSWMCTQPPMPTFGQRMFHVGIQGALTGAAVGIYALSKGILS